MPGTRPSRVEGSLGFAPGECGGYSVRRSGSEAEVDIGLSLGDCVCVANLRLPGDGFEEADTDDQREGERKDDGPGIGRKAWARNRHEGFSLKRAKRPRRRESY